ncbi:MAG TPA: hypothetical protein VE981_23485 [Planctomycetota bacterium]|nr:hypothetical protein [Planctomycetota bacterium]
MKTPLWTLAILAALAVPAVAQEPSAEEKPKSDAPIPDAVPVPDRWRIPFSYYPLNEPGSLVDPYHQNILKGDYPILGQDIFLNLTGRSDTTIEARRLPTPTNVSTNQARNPDFFGGGDQLFLNQDFAATVEVYQGDTAFRPRAWEFRATAALNYNYVDVRENSLTHPNPAEGATRGDKHAALQECLAEVHLADISPNYDFISIRAGIQPFTSDFRGFIFKDTNLGVRLFGTLLSNRIQWNIAGFDQLEKDTNSNLNTIHKRGQRIYIANLYIQDSIWEGYTTQFSFHNSRDTGDVHYDDNDFLVRPAKIGTIQVHDVNPYYFGWAGDGHIGPLNLSHALYLARGNDEYNQIAGRQVDIAGEFGAIELSFDVDWLRFRGSFLWASGDKNPTDGRATGFDTIFDNPFWAGGPFSYWNRQSLGLQGVNLVNRDSLVPDLRSSKTQGQINFVNPGLVVYNVGVDADLLPELKSVFNASLMKFQNTSSLETFAQQADIHHNVGFDVSMGVVLRPLLNNNVIMTAGAAGFFPGRGFRDIYESGDALYSFFLELSLTY